MSKSISLLKCLATLSISLCLAGCGGSGPKSLPDDGAPLYTAADATSRPGLASPDPAVVGSNLFEIYNQCSVFKPDAVVSSAEDLVTAGFLKEVPPAPAGKKWVLKPDMSGFTLQ